VGGFVEVVLDAETKKLELSESGTGNCCGDMRLGEQLFKLRS
jgi:hypothetical protein